MSLPPDFCEKVKGDQVPRLAVDPREPCDLEVGQVHWLTSRLAIKIEKRSRGRKGELLFAYSLIDNRDFYLRPTGQMLKMASSAIAAKEKLKVQSGRETAIESAYDGNPRDPLDAGRSVPPEYKNVLAMGARVRASEYRRLTAAEREAKKDLRRVNAELRELVTRAVKMGVDPLTVLAPIAREIKAQHRDLREAA